MTTPEETIADLQIRLAFQEDQLSVLDTEVAQQNQRIEVLEQQVKYLASRLKTVGDDAAALPLVEQRPPHY